MAVTLLLAAGSIAPVNAAEVAPAKGVFLIATENLDGSSFERTVILLTHLDHTGAMGVAINRKSGYAVADFFKGLGTAPLFLGGPVRPDALFVLGRNPEAPRRSHVLEDIYLVAGPDAQKLLAAGDGARKATEHRAIAGYSGWAPGQLEGEIERGDWETLAAETRFTLQEDTEQLWTTLLQLARARWI